MADVAAPLNGLIPTIDVDAGFHAVELEATPVPFATPDTVMAADPAPVEDTETAGEEATGLTVKV